MLERTLEKIGLADKEARVYLALLELGQATVQQIAKKAGIVRPTTYVILEKLMQLGLVSSADSGKKTQFVAEDPHELSNILAEQRHQLDLRTAELDGAMQQLVAIHNTTGSKPTVRYYEGSDGLEALDRYGDKFPSDEALSIIPIDLLEHLFPERRRDAVTARVKAGIRSRVIYTRAAGPLNAETNHKELREAVYLTNDLLPVNMTIAINSWGVRLFYLDKEHPYGVLIEDASIARNMKVMFELAWMGAKQLSQHK